ncbi:hypothetical protein [Paraburkholderia fynbosensis]|uniref:Uncharacterized protein n=1 Tax=Paraburkholderia fynbosensis TaxID=1200993 RepID=A0A6J5H8J3_9BURK|nr:hypothetical protein [Paraburkholderia fynbosensis]CAB3810708.1 hypothetical protein LMG27177_07401 [Paraburkholderia fynbosensis]
MLPQLWWFFVSIAFSFTAWGVLTRRYVWPKLRLLRPVEALRPLLILHSFRFIGLAFLVPGVVSPELPSTFAYSAAYGDLVAAILASLSLVLLPRGAGIVVVWIFNVWGLADLLNAFYQANDGGLVPGQLGATYFIPTLVVPLLLITHGLIFRILLQHHNQPAMRESRQPGEGLSSGRSMIDATIDLTTEPQSVAAATRLAR